MSEAREFELVKAETTVYERVSEATVGVAILSFVLANAALFQVTTVDTTLFGVTLFDLFGASLLVMGATVLGLGVSSAVGLAETAPSYSPGSFAVLAFGVVGLVVGALLGSQTLGVGLLGWLSTGAAFGVATAAVTVFPEEDLGTTVPVGSYVAAAGVAVLTGVVGLDWGWEVGGLSAVFTGPVVVPVLVAVAALGVAWAAAKAASGFGRRGRERGAILLITLNALGMLAVLLVLIVFIVDKGLTPVLDGVQFGPGLNVDWPFVMRGYSLLPGRVNGVYPAIVGTVWVVLGAVLFAVPLGVGAAVFLTEYAERERLTATVETATNGLWSTPSIVFGLFGYAFLVPRFGNQTSLFAGMLVLGFMLLPLVLITSREAILSVPDEYRDASAALGVTKWQTIRSVVLPASMPGIITGVILGVGRIAGETAPILLVMAGGLRESAPNVLGGFQFAAQPPFVTNDALLQSAPALPYQLYAIITAGVSGNQSFGWGTALVLLMVVLSFYVVGIGSRLYFRRKLNDG